MVPLLARLLKSFYGSTNQTVLSERLPRRIPGLCALTCRCGPLEPKNRASTGSCVRPSSHGISLPLKFTTNYSICHRLPNQPYLLVRRLKPHGVERRSSVLPPWMHGSPRGKMARGFWRPIDPAALKMDPRVLWLGRSDGGRLPRPPRGSCRRRRGHQPHRLAARHGPGRRPLAGHGPRWWRLARRRRMAGTAPSWRHVGAVQPGAF